MTSTFSAIIDYSVNDIVRQLHRIQAVNNILNDLKDIITFPGEERSAFRSHDSNTNTDFSKFTDDFVEQTVPKTLNDAIIRTRKLGMVEDENSWNFVFAQVAAVIKPRLSGN